MGKFRFYVTMVVLFVLGLVGVTKGLRDLRGTNGAVNFNEMDYDALKEGMYVRGTTDMVVDYYCEEKTTKNGATSTARWYLIPYSNDTETYRFIAVKVFDKMIPDYEKVVDDTEAYNSGEVAKLSYELKVNGEVKACEGDVKKYLNEYIAEVEKETGESWDGVFAPYYIQMVHTGSSKVVIGICSAMVVISAAVLIFSFIKARKEKASYDTYSSETGYSSSAYDQPTPAAQPMDELDKILADADAQVQKDDDNPYQY